MTDESCTGCQRILTNLNQNNLIRKILYLTDESPTDFEDCFESVVRVLICLALPEQLSEEEFYALISKTYKETKQKKETK